MNIKLFLLLLIIPHYYLSSGLFDKIAIIALRLKQIRPYWQNIGAYEKIKKCGCTENPESLTSYENRSSKSCCQAVRIFRYNMHRLIEMEEQIRLKRNKN